MKPACAAPRRGQARRSGRGPQCSRRTAAMVGARRAPHLAPLAKPVAAACRVARSLGSVPAQGEVEEGEDGKSLG
jgi:hypothetical protein